MVRHGYSWAYHQYDVHGSKHLDHTHAAVALYTSFLGLPTVNITCSIKPQLLNVNVTYENNGIVTVESMARIPVDLPTNSSAAVLVTMIGLETNLFFAQGLIGIMNIGPPDDPDSMGALAAPLPLSIISQPEHLVSGIVLTISCH